MPKNCSFPLSRDAVASLFLVTTGPSAIVTEGCCQVGNSICLP